MARHRLGTLSLSKHRGVRRALLPLGVFLTALLTLTSILFLVIDFSPAEYPLFTLTAVLSSLILLALLPKLRQRNQNAWAMTMLLTAVIVINHWLHGSNIIIVIDGLLVIAYLWWQRRAFHGRGIVPSSTAAERQHVLQIIQQHGRAAVSHLSLLSDKSYWFSSGGSAVAYLVKAHIALVLGDPIGPAEEAAVAIRGFRDFCHRQGWQPAFYQTEPAYTDLYKAAGFEVVCIGYEALAHLPTLTPSPHTQTIEIMRPPHSPTLLNTLHEVNDEWLTLMAGDEGYLSFSWFAEETLAQVVLALSRNEQNDIIAFATLFLYDDGRKAAVDLLRRCHEVDDQTVEHLLAALCSWCQQQGVETLSWGLSLLSEVDEAAVGSHLNRFYEKQGVPDFQAKFVSQWQPQYVVFPGHASLPAVCLALTLASNRGGWRSYVGERPLLLRQMVRLVDEQYKSHTAVIQLSEVN